MISYHQFNTLNEEKKAEYILHHGIFLSHCYKGIYGINLYGINDYYTEVWYNLELDRVEEIRCYNGTVPLNKFLENISIESLFAF